MPSRRSSLLALLPLAAVVWGCDVFEPDSTPAFALISVGARHGCALDSKGRAYCWGNNSDGQLGTGDNQRRLTATPVEGGLRFRALEAVDDRTCGVDVVGRVYCWGNNDWGQLGDGSVGHRRLPVVVRWGMRFIDLSLGTYHACGLRADGTVHCWGRNNWGQIGAGPSHFCGFDRVCNRFPSQAAGGRQFTEVRAGVGHTCALTADGRAFCWGWNELGQLGDGHDVSFRFNAAPVAGAERFVRLVGGAAHTCGVLADGGLRCWGSDFGAGALGDGQIGGEPRRVPVAVAEGNIFTMVASSKENWVPHACGIDSSGAVWCWGANDRGQLGAEAQEGACEYSGMTFPCTARPMRTEIALAFQEVELGRALTCALTRGGEAWCWGANEAGQQGNGRIGDVDPLSRVLFPGERLTPPASFPSASPAARPASRGSSHSDQRLVER